MSQLQIRKNKCLAIFDTSGWLHAASADPELRKFMGVSRWAKQPKGPVFVIRGSTALAIPFPQEFTCERHRSNYTNVKPRAHILLEEERWEKRD